MWLYEHNQDNSARYILGEFGTNPLICVGVNPSTATPEKLDPTLRNVKKFAELNNYDGWLMLNLYPQRTTDPNRLHQKRSPELHRQNLQFLQLYLREYKEICIWAAWGTLINKRSYLKDCLDDIVKQIGDYKSKWITIGRTSKEGHPHHPLYVSHAHRPKQFDITQYLANLP